MLKDGSARDLVLICGNMIDDLTVAVRGLDLCDASSGQL